MVQRDNAGGKRRLLGMQSLQVRGRRSRQAKCAQLDGEVGFERRGRSQADCGDP